MMSNEPALGGIECLLERSLRAGTRSRFPQCHPLVHRQAEFDRLGHWDLHIIRGGLTRECCIMGDRPK